VTKTVDLVVNKTNTLFYGWFVWFRKVFKGVLYYFLSSGFFAEYLLSVLFLLRVPVGSVRAAVGALEWFILFPTQLKNLLMN